MTRNDRPAAAKTATSPKSWGAEIEHRRKLQPLSQHHSDFLVNHEPVIQQDIDEQQAPCAVKKLPCPDGKPHQANHDPKGLHELIDLAKPAIDGDRVAGILSEVGEDVDEVKRDEQQISAQKQQQE